MGQLRRPGAQGLRRVRVADDEVPVRVCAAGVDRASGMSMTGLPYAIRLPGSGSGRPNTPLRAAMWRASWRRGGSDVTRFEPGDEVFGVKLRLAKVTHSGVVPRVASSMARALANGGHRGGGAVGAGVAGGTRPALRAAQRLARSGRCVGFVRLTLAKAPHPEVTCGAVAGASAGDSRASSGSPVCAGGAGGVLGL